MSSRDSARATMNFYCNFTLSLSLSDRGGKHSHDAEVSALGHLDWDKTISLGVPAAGRGWLDARAIILLDDAGHHIFELFVKFS